MQVMRSEKYDHTALSDNILPLIYDCAGEERLDYRIDTLKSVALNYLLLRDKPTRITFHRVSDMLGIAREQGFPDHKINTFLSALEHLIQQH